MPIWKQQFLRIFHQKVWTIRQSISSYRNCQPQTSWNSQSVQEMILRCKQVWNNWEQLQCVVHSPPIVGMTKAFLFSLRTCIVQIQSVRVNIACTRRLLNLSTEAIINVRNARLCARCAKFLEKINHFFFLSFSQGAYIFEESPKSVQDVIGDVYCPGKYCSNRDKCESLGGFVTTPRSIYGCRKCGAWFFVHKVPFIIQEHVETTKTDRT